MKKKKLLYYSLLLPFVIGTFLILINLIGYSIPLRNPELHDLENQNDKTLLTKEQFYKQIEWNNENEKEYLYKFNTAVYNAIAHYWPDDDIDKFSLRVPFYKNYILYFASFINPQTYQKYEFCNYRYAIERGLGLCSQRSIVVSEILSEKGFKTKIASLTGHVVPTVQLKNGDWWVLGPSYNVIIEKNLEEIEKNPEIIRSYYESKYDKNTVDNLIKIFGKEGNIIFEGVSEYCGDKLLIENASYILIWVIPIILMFPLTLLHLLPKLKKVGILAPFLS